MALAASSRRICRTPRKASADITTLPRKSAIGPKGMNGKNGFSGMNRAARLARMAQARADVAPVQRPAGKALVTPPEALDEERPIARARAGGIALRCVGAVAHRRLRHHRRPPQPRARRQGRVDRLALSPALRLGCVLR